MTASPFGIRLCVLSDGQRIPLLVDRRTDLPLDPTTRFTLARRWQVGDSSSTAESELRAIGYFLAWAERVGVDLDQRFGSGDFFAGEEIEGLVDALRESQRAGGARREENVVWVGLDRNARKLAKASPHRAVVGNDVWYQRIKYVQGYVAWLMDDVISCLPTNHDRFTRIRDRRTEVLKKLEDQLPDTTQRHREGLLPQLRARFLEIIHPESPDNPFQAGNRYRNYALLRLYYDIGCRLAELLVLYTTDFDPDTQKPTITIRRRPNNPLDPRRDLPLVKTNERIIPLTREMADVLETYILRERSKVPGAKKTPFMFLARDGSPIAPRTVEDMPLQIRRRHPEFEGHLMMHVLRHDWNDRFSELADERKWPEAKETQHRNYLQGWKKTSKQGLNYTRRSTREEANNAALAIQKKDWNRTSQDD